MVRRKDRKYQPRPPRGNNALRAAASCMSYEYEMFLTASNLLLSLDPSSSRPEVVIWRNVALESTLIHSRNIRDFFSPNGRSDDVLARDFVTPLPRIAMPYLRKASTERKINRLLAHPSYGRSRLTKEWEIGTLRREITTAWNAFLSRLGQEAPEQRSLFR